VLDETQDKTLLWARQAEGVTSFAFTMPVQNCGDPGQDVVIPHDRFIHVLYAYGENGAKVRKLLVHRILLDHTTALISEMP
jgi:hypothetical protein